MACCVSIPKCASRTDVRDVNDKIFFLYFIWLFLVPFTVPSTWEVSLKFWLFEDNGINVTIKQNTRCYGNQIYGVCVAQIPSFVQCF